MMLLTRAAWVCQGARDQLCPQRNVLELPHGPLAQAARAPWLRLPAAPVRQLGGYGNSPRSTGLEKGQATSWSAAGMKGLVASRASCHRLYQCAAPTDGGPLEKPPGPALAALLLTLPTRKHVKNMQKGANKHLKKYMHPAWYAAQVKQHRASHPVRKSWFLLQWSYLQ